MSRILLVDDDIAEISSVKRVLVRGGHQPALATNASDAQVAVARELPELLIVSATCENGEALTLARRLLQAPETAKLPLLVLGDADPMPDGARRLSRPVDPEQLLAEVDATLGAKGALSLEEPAPRAAPRPGPAAPKVRPAPAPLGRMQPAQAIIPPPPAAPRAPARPGPKARPAPGPAPAATPPAGATALFEPLPAPPGGATDAAASRRAAADALRARAEELRRSRPSPTPPPEAAALAPVAARGPALDLALDDTPDGGDDFAGFEAGFEAGFDASLAPASAAMGAPAGIEPEAPEERPPQPSLAEALALEEDELEAALQRSRVPKDGALAASFSGPEPSPAPAPDEVDDARQQAADDALRALEEEATNHAAEVARARRAEREAAEDDRQAFETERRAVENERLAIETERMAAETARQAAEAERRTAEDARIAAEAERQAIEDTRIAADAERLAAEAEARAARAAEERALQEAIETARREAFEAARREAFEAARREAFETARRELQEETRREAAEAAKLVQAEARARQEAVQHAQREAQSLAQQRAEAEQRARAAEAQLQEMRRQLEQERRQAEERVATVMQRAVQEGEAADELRRIAEEEVRRRDEELNRGRDEEEEKLREAIASAQAEMVQLRRKSEDDTRRRAEAEAALERLEEERRREAERQAAEAVEELARPLARAPVGAADRPDGFTPPPFFAPFDGAQADALADGLADELAETAEPPPPDPTEDAARRRVAALRSGAAEDALGPPTDLLASRAEPARAPLAPPPEEPPSRIIPPPPAPLRAGELGDLPLPRLLAMAAKAKLDGRIDLAGEVSRSLWFEGGRVVGAQSADPTERVEEIALRLGLITRDQHRQVAQATAALPSRRAALLLLERGFLKATELTGLVRRRIEEVVFGAFAEEGGRFRWASAEVPPEERTALDRGALALAVEGVRRRWRAPRVDALLGGPATLLAPVAGAAGPAELGLGAEERRVVALADGLRALDEIVQASPLDALSTRQVLAALVMVGALGVRVLHAGRPRGGAAAAIDLARVKDKLEQVRRADYFTVLGVGRLCTPHEVREAAERLLAEFDPRRFAGVPDEGLPARLSEIVQVIQDAREVLADDRLREEYLRGLGDAG